jgi:hypothetical protein
VASRVGAPKWGQSRSQYMPRKGPCRTYSRGALRRPKPKYVQYSIHVHYCKETPQPFFKHTRWKTNIQDIHCSICTCILSPAITVYFSCTSCVCIITGVYFRRLKINHESHEFTLDHGTVVNNFVILKHKIIVCRSG